MILAAKVIIEINPKLQLDRASSLGKGIYRAHRRSTILCRNKVPTLFSVLLVKNGASYAPLYWCPYTASCLFALSILQSDDERYSRVSMPTAWRLLDPK